jgi:hypothetical protein
MSSSPIVRALRIDERHIRLSILEMVQANVTKALIELITNSDDSYARLEASGIAVTGRIQIDVIERRSGEGGESLLRVIDDAEGFDRRGLEERFGTMGLDTAGQRPGTEVRGFFGDGLKEAVLGLKKGGVLRTIRNGKFAQAELMWEGNRPVFRLRQPPTPVTAAQRRELGLQGDGTHLTVFLGPDIRIPHHDNLVEQLSRHCSLRDILQNDARRIIVGRLNARGRLGTQDEAIYREPKMDTTFGTRVLPGIVRGYDTPFTITLKRSIEPLSGAEEGPLRDGGLLVRARRSIVDVGFFGLDNKPGTEHLFGYLDCPALDDRLRNEDVVVAKNRAGLNRQNEFVRALLNEAGRLLTPILKEEAERQKSGEGKPLDAKARRRLEELKNELNRIAKLELEEEGEESGDAEGSLALRFSRNGFTLYVGEPRAIRVIAKAENVRPGDVLQVEAVGDGLQLSPSAIPLSTDDAVEGYISCEAQLLGTSELSAGLLEARIGDLKATATVTVKKRIEIAPPAFSFEHDAYRVPVAKWKELALRIHVPSVAGLPAQVSFALDAGDMQVRPDAEIADPLSAKDEWISLRVQVRGDQIGSEDTLEARMGTWVTTTRLKIVSGDSPEKKTRGGLIHDIRYDPREEPVQRTLFQSGVLTIYVNHSSVKRYLARQEDRDTPAGRALVADLAMHAFCRYIAEQTYKDDPFLSDTESVLQTVFNTYERMIKKYGEKIHAIMNPA